MLNILELSGIEYSLAIMCGLISSCSEIMHNISKCYPSIESIRLSRYGRGILSRLSRLSRLNIISCDLLKVIDFSSVNIIRISWMAMIELQTYDDIILDNVRDLIIYDYKHLEYGMINPNPANPCLHISLSMFPELCEIELIGVRLTNVLGLDKFTRLFRLCLTNNIVDNLCLRMMNDYHIDQLYLHHVLDECTNDIWLPSSKIRYLLIAGIDFRLSRFQITSSPIEYIGLFSVVKHLIRNEMKNTVRRLEYYNCDNFVVNVGDYPNLEYLEMRDCNNFKINDDIDYKIEMRISDCTRFLICAEDISSIEYLIISRSHDYTFVMMSEHYLS